MVDIDEIAISVCTLSDSEACSLYDAIARNYLQRRNNLDEKGLEKDALRYNRAAQHLLEAADDLSRT